MAIQYRFCNRINQKVTLTVDLAYPNDQEVITELHKCNYQEKCGVVEHTGLSTQYYWEICPIVQEIERLKRK